MKKKKQPAFKVTINWELVDEMLEAHCSGVSIAKALGIHYETLYDRLAEEKKMMFHKYAQMKKACGADNIKLHQYRKAIGSSEKGDNGMLIWLGKQWCEQREPRENSFDSEEVRANLNKMVDSISLARSSIKKESPEASSKALSE